MEPWQQQWGLFTRVAQENKMDEHQTFAIKDNDFNYFYVMAVV